MAKHSRARTIALPWRRVWAALPSIALIGGGIAVTAPAGVLNGAPPQGAPAAVVPDLALRMAGTRAEPYGRTTPEHPALVLPDGSSPAPSKSRPRPTGQQPTAQQPAAVPGASATPAPTSTPRRSHPALPLPAIPIPGSASTAALYAVPSAEGISADRTIALRTYLVVAGV